MDPHTFVTEILRVLYFFVPAYLANMAPVLAQGTCRGLAVPMDGGRTLGGKRILGDHKTWRGFLAGIVVGGIVGWLQAAGWQAGIGRNLAPIEYTATTGLTLGLLMGLGAGTGDAVKSFFKRRIGVAPGASWLGFDQLDFMAGAYLLAALVYAPPLLPTLASLPVVFAGSLATTATGYVLGLKEAWI
jgi:CDP-2,3-bis-(O-geranylgeranyl)-sn-glycerol synthase